MPLITLCINGGKVRPGEYAGDGGPPIEIGARKANKKGRRKKNSRGGKGEKNDAAHSLMFYTSILPPAKYVTSQAHSRIHRYSLRERGEGMGKEMTSFQTWGKSTS